MSALKALSATRAAIGTSGWAMPITAGKLFGIDASKDVSAALYLRLGGTRDFALAAGPLMTAGPARRKLLAVAAACDLGDIAAVAIAQRRGKISPLSAGLFTAASLACLGLSAKAIADTQTE
ncbi:hypothetical protein FHT44_006605 [Mycolicibacterium sp. BK634]|uniref:hypothetical protein n=1 Tax=Mycolicibacterium sp. BK634 TaxID=2587099 RepID=UPI001613D298|nr:hypothetical protein [Mycolicibacterium sp. BK634]MBB3754083.1 hypothetical protein [Mycolicibacterium sp. BK634]